MALIVLIGVALATAVYAKTTLTVPGAGPSTRVVALFFEHFASTRTGNRYEHVVPPGSIKHAGGIVVVRNFSNSEAWRRAVGAAGFLPPS